MGNYYVYIQTDNERGCPKFDDIDSAVEKYNATKMEVLGDCVFLGYENGKDLCFDILHKFFEENVLINDYLNHDDKEAKDVVKLITNRVQVKYQFTSDILGGTLIDYAVPIAPYTSGVKMDEKWNELNVSTYKDGNMNIIGWVKPTNETLDKYGWQYTKVASYVSMMNVPFYDENGIRHDADVDPRIYLQRLGKKVSVRKEGAA